MFGQREYGGISTNWYYLRRRLPRAARPISTVSFHEPEEHWRSEPFIYGSTSTRNPSSSVSQRLRRPLHIHQYSPEGQPWPCVPNLSNFTFRSARWEKLQCRKRILVDGQAQLRAVFIKSGVNYAQSSNLQFSDPQPVKLAGDFSGDTNSTPAGPGTP